MEEQMQAPEMAGQRASPSGVQSAPLALPFAERRLLLMALDLLTINAALLLALATRPKIHLRWQLLAEHPLWFLLLSALWLPLAHAFDAYDRRKTARFTTSVAAVVRSGLLTVLVYSLIPYLSPPLPASRSALLTFPLFALALLVAGRSAYALVVGRPLFQRRALIVGAGWAGRTIAKVLAQASDNTYQLVGYVDDDPQKLGKDVIAGESGRPLPVLGDRHAMPTLIQQYRVSTLILAITHQVDGKLLQTLMDCLELGVDIVPMPVLYEQLTGRVPVAHVGGNWDVALPIDHPGTGALWPLLKRVLDIVLASLGLLFLGLVLPFIALAIYIDSPGPIFYTQKRVGKGGRVFKVFKLRSMVPDAEKGGAVWASKGDARITRVGRLLRKTHLDEFPQFINILKGEMSAVGPRPERPEFVEELAQAIPFYRVRHAVKPGMAGWGLVKQGYGSSSEDALLKLQYDLYYIKHQSLGLDLVILLKTVIDALTLGGR
jgi:exopolysaccharide biosynthesis polyprenyl glycosylphosphotransferase